jgi:hypothetical protein
MCQTSKPSATPGIFCGCDDQPYHVLPIAASCSQYEGELTARTLDDEQSLVIILFVLSFRFFFNNPNSGSDIKPQFKIDKPCKTNPFKFNLSANTATPVFDGVGGKTESVF